MTSHLMTSMCELLFSDQANECDLRRNPESHRWSPIPRAAAYVDPHAAEAIEPRDERLLQRSEEHTSELQSLAYLVCRLLLEKKKKNTGISIINTQTIRAERFMSTRVSWSA